MTRREASERMTVEEARDYLGVSRQKMASLISTSVLHATENRLDRRIKLLERREVEELKAQFEGLPRGRRKNAA